LLGAGKSPTPFLNNALIYGIFLLNYIWEGHDMKKILLFLLMVLMMTGCSAEKKAELPHAEGLLTELKGKNSNLEKIQAFTAETDPNEKLGRPGYYISKADFSDTRLEQEGSEYLVGGTLETFSSKGDCNKRAEYLNKMNDPSIGFLAVNQHIYKYDKVLLRVDYSLTSEQAEEYKIQFDEIMKQYE
jgi:hypothetical protein